MFAGTSESLLVPIPSGVASGLLILVVMVVVTVTIYVCIRKRNTRTTSPPVLGQYIAWQAPASVFCFDCEGVEVVFHKQGKPKMWIHNQVIDMTRFYTAKLLHKDIPTVNYEYLNTRELFNHYFFNIYKPELVSAINFVFPLFIIYVTAIAESSTP